MWNSKKSVNLSICVCGFTIISIIVAAIFVPWWAKNYFLYLFDWDHTQYLKYIAFMFSFYPCASLGILAVFLLIKILFRIKKGNPFCNENVKSLKIISWCCFFVSLITLLASPFYIPLIIVAVAAGFFGLILRVVKNVIHAAVELKKENDLTI